MSSGFLRTIFLFSVFSAALFLGGCGPAGNAPTAKVRIEISGFSEHPVDIAWTIHGTSLTVGGLILNHPASSPYVIQKSVREADFDTVSVAITDSGATGGVVLGSGTCTASSGTDEKFVTLDFNTENPVGSGNFIVDQWDLLVDSAARHYGVSLPPDTNGVVIVSDVNNNFPGAGEACSLYASNRSSITVTFARDGITLHTFTGSTVTEAVDMSYGSSVW